MNRRNLLLGTTGLALGIVGCSNSSGEVANPLSLVTIFFSGGAVVWCIFNLLGRSIEGGKSERSSKKVTLADCPALNAYIDSLCDIPDGTFMMGSSDEHSFEAPVHHVPISAFRMGKTPVTVAMWEEYVNHTSRSMPREPNPTFEGGQKFNVGWTDKDHPIVNVSWADCQEYASWASDVSGVQLNLPSEARWEYACRGGNEGLKYPWGNEYDRSKIWGSYEEYGDRGSTGSVGRRVYVWQDHPWGLIDMQGNVAEWCEDWFDPTWYGIPQASERDIVNIDSSPIIKVNFMNKKDVKAAMRCVRGGSWMDPGSEAMTNSRRAYMHPAQPTFVIGFRLVAPPK